MIITTIYTGDGSGANPFRPLGADDWMSWRSLDMRDDPSLVDGECMFEGIEPWPDAPLSRSRSAGLSDDEVASIAQEKVAPKVQAALGSSKKEVWLGGRLLYSEDAPVIEAPPPIDPSDDFNRADAGNLGANWIQQRPVLIQSNQAVSTDAGIFGVACHVTQAASNDVWAQITCKGVAGSGSAGNRWMQVGVRVNNSFDGSGPYTDVYSLATEAQANKHNLFKYAGGSYTELWADYGSSYGVNENLRIEVTGSTIRCYYCGVEFTSSPTTDTSVTGANYRKFCIAFVGASTDLIAIDDFKAGDLPYAGDYIRYYPRPGNPGRMSGAIFEGTDGDKDTGPYTTIYTCTPFSNTTAWAKILCDLGTYRYLRYRGGTNSFGNIAEVEWYRAGVKLTGTTFGSSGGSAGSSDYTVVYDGNTATFFDTGTATGAYSGIDTGAVVAAGQPAVKRFGGIPHMRRGQQAIW